MLSQVTETGPDLEHRDRQRGQNQRDESSAGKLAQREGSGREAPDTCWLSHRTQAGSVFWEQWELQESSRCRAASGGVLEEWKVPIHQSGGGGD